MKHIGLVLSGGMGKGAYQIGALTAVREFFAPSDFEYISSASIGVLNTYAFLTGNLEKAYSIWNTMNLQGDKRFVTWVLRSTFLQDTIRSIVSDKKIAGSFYVPLLDLLNRELNYYNFSDIAPNEIEPYLRAGVAMPFYNQGVKIGSRVLYDGAVVDNIPIYPVLKNDLDYVICIYFDDYNYIFEDYCLDDRIIKLTFPDKTRMSNSIYIRHDSIVYMMEEGYRRTKEKLSYIFADGTDNLERIYSRIAEGRSGSQEKIRITGDVIVTNMNKVAQKVVRHKRILEGEAVYG